MSIFVGLVVSALFCLYSFLVLVFPLHFLWPCWLFTFLSLAFYPVLGVRLICPRLSVSLFPRFDCQFWLLRAVNLFLQRFGCPYERFTFSVSVFLARFDCLFLLFLFYCFCTVFPFLVYLFWLFIVLGIILSSLSGLSDLADHSARCHMFVLALSILSVCFTLFWLSVLTVRFHVVSRRGLLFFYAVLAVRFGYEVVLILLGLIGSAVFGCRLCVLAIFIVCTLSPCWQLSPRSGAGIAEYEHLRRQYLSPFVERKAVHFVHTQVRHSSSWF